MKILHVPFHYFPDPVGGTEVYVASLAEHLRDRGVEAEVAAPSLATSEYSYAGVPVHRFGIGNCGNDAASLYGDGDHDAARDFARILDAAQPALVHFHAMSPAISVNVLTEVRARRIPALFTCHIPGIVCPRGTLLRNGTEVCDGVWNLQKCTACVLQGKGLNEALAGVVAATPAPIGRAIATVGRGSAFTAIRMRDLQSQRRRNLITFFDRVDRVIAVSRWMRDVLVANGVDRGKVLLCRHGFTQTANREAALPRRSAPAHMHLAFLGRLNPDKGVHLVLEALRRRPALDVSLDIFAIVQDDAAYVAAIKEAASRDRRIRLLPPLANDCVISTLRGYDALVVPSQWLETGPLVVYDAFAAGIPVIGSRRGGLMEIVTDGCDGMLVEPGDPDAWAVAIERLAVDRGFRDHLRTGVRPPRSMGAVAEEMIELYSTHLAKRAAVA